MFRAVSIFTCAALIVAFVACSDDDTETKDSGVTPDKGKSLDKGKTVDKGPKPTPDKGPKPTPDKGPPAKDPFKNKANWEAFDASKTGGLKAVGYFGASFDKKYVYYVPCNDAQSSFHGVVLRYNTTGPFNKASSWQAYDAGKTDGLTTVGYGGAIFDGRYVYFVPFVDGKSRHGKVLRYDTQGDFTKASAWAAFDAGMVDSMGTKGFVGASFHGGYIYLVPFGYAPIAHGRVLRYNTKQPFKNASYWSAYDAGKTDGLETKGYYGVARDNRYIYFAPFNDAKAFHGRVLRYDTQGDFKKAASWSAYDASKTDGMDTIGYKWARWDGRYVYFVPFRDTKGRHGRVLRYDTQGDFKKASSWSAYDAGKTDGLDTKAYVGAVYDMRYVYFIPYSGENNTFHARAMRYDTKADFKKASSWSAFDASSIGGMVTKGYKGGAFDGRYVYYVPYNNGAMFSGIALRFDTKGK